MTYQAELSFMQNILTKCRLQFLLLDPFSEIDFQLDFGLRNMLGKSDQYEKAFYSEFRCAEENTIYRLTDPFQCKYIYFLLPEQEDPTIAVLGPYMLDELTYEQILESSETQGTQPRLLNQFIKFYSSIPVIENDNFIYFTISAFAEHIWGGSDSYKIVDINQKLIPEDISFYSQDTSPRPEETAWNMSTVFMIMIEIRKLLLKKLEGTFAPSNFFILLFVYM